MANTPRLVMPEISESQASKSVTHNSALRVLDALVMCCVIDKDLSEPPGSPSDGDMYIVGATASSGSDWTGEEDSIAYYGNTAWEFHTPEEGWLAFVKDEGIFYYYAGASAGWQSLAGGIGS